MSVFSSEHRVIGLGRVWWSGLWLGVLVAQGAAVAAEPEALAEDAVGSRWDGWSWPSTRGASLDLRAVGLVGAHPNDRDLAGGFGLAGGLQLVGPLWAELGMDVGFGRYGTQQGLQADGDPMNVGFEPWLGLRTQISPSLAERPAVVASVLTRLGLTGGLPGAPVVPWAAAGLGADVRLDRSAVLRMGVLGQGQLRPSSRRDAPGTVQPGDALRGAVRAELGVAWVWPRAVPSVVMTVQPMETLRVVSPLRNFPAPSADGTTYVPPEFCRTESTPSTTSATGGVSQPVVSGGPTAAGSESVVEPVFVTVRPGFEVLDASGRVLEQSELGTLALPTATRLTWRGAGQTSTSFAATLSGYANFVAVPGEVVKPEPLRINFEVASSVVSAEAELQLATLAENLGGWTIVAGGSASPEGDEAANRVLAERRSEAVVEKLLAFGVSPGAVVDQGVRAADPSLPLTAQRAVVLTLLPPGETPPPTSEETP